MPTLHKLMPIGSALRHFGGIFDLESKIERLEEVQLELENPKIWEQADRAQALGQERVQLAAVVDAFRNLDQSLSDHQELLELLASENDEVGIAALVEDFAKMEAEIDALEFQRMFSGKMDAADAYIDINSGSGGTEAQDWAEILLRMYLRFAEKKGFSAELAEVSPGEVAGIKSATIHVKGPYAYGWLRTETGVHRLVRKSPFDANHKRHTSFAAVFVAPDLPDDIEVDINPADLRIDTYRASGAGGQHVNRTDSAVRITHEPSGIVVQCQSDRSQHKNKAQAMKQLKAKLYELEMQKRQQEQQALEGTKSENSWGNQIRSYVLDESRIKDLRTNFETRHPKTILDGDLEKMIIESLKQGV